MTYLTDPEINKALVKEANYKERIDAYNRIAQKVYNKDYRELCPDKQRNIKTLYKTGDF